MIDKEDIKISAPVIAVEMVFSSILTMCLIIMECVLGVLVITTNI